MQHSVKSIGENYELLSNMRKDVVRFVAKDFYDFAKQNINKYSLLEREDDLRVSTWYSDSLIKDYQNSIKKTI
jgi:hypothetical protein